MKTSLPTRSITTLVSFGSESPSREIGVYVSDAPAGDVQRVRVRRRAICLDGRRIAAIRAYREHAELA